MNDQSQPQLPAGHATTLTITQAAEAMGVDTFTMLGFIQRGTINSTRSQSGEITVPESELAKLMENGR